MTAALTFATRPSVLARRQTQWVMAALQAIHPGLRCEERIITTHGDRALDKPLPEIGGKGLFTEELESALLSEQVECAVHSLKDLPVDAPGGLTIACVPERVDVRDALISHSGLTLQALPKGASIGTSSTRRAAQILALRPDLGTRDLRGNVDTRLRKAQEGDYDAIVLAGAGLIRLGLERHVTQWLALEEMLPAPGQGALAVQCRADDLPTLTLLAGLEHRATRKAVTAERAFLQVLGGGCAVPVAALGRTVGLQGSEIDLTGLVISADGRSAVRVSRRGKDPLQLGEELAQEALGRGAGEILGLTAAR